MTSAAHFPTRGCRAGPSRRALPAVDLLTLALAGGCAAPPKPLLPRLQDEDPAVRALAAAEAARTRDAKALPYLVDRLSDAEPDVRLLASVALQDLAGSKVFAAIGWRFYDPPEERSQAQERWRDWLRQGMPANPPPATRPAPASQASTTREGGSPSPRTGDAPATRPASLPGKEARATP
jgi:hypothetical protein